MMQDGIDPNDGDVPNVDLTIRTLQSEDCSRLIAMDKPWSGRNRQQWFEGKLKRALAEADVCISLGAELDGILVGAVMGSVHFGEFGQPEPVAVLDTILVDSRFGRRGIATAMFDQLVLNLRGLRIATLRTEVSWDEQHLIGFLARSGFTPAPRMVLERQLMEP